MILDQREARIVSSMGWVEHGALLVWDTETNTTSLLPVDDSEYLSLASGDLDQFAVVHQRRGGGYSITVRDLATPEEVLARATVSGGVARLEGDSEAWSHVPASYIGYAPVEANDERAPYALLVVEGSACEVQRMEWFNADTYDLMYQSLGSPVSVTGEALVLIPIQRSSKPVVYDLDARKVVGHLELADRGGNPTLRFRTPGELWADDYDTILRLDRNGWATRDQRRLQDAVEGTIRSFIGGWSFNRDRSLCAVARPFSGDVVGIDTSTFQIAARAELGAQPLEVAVLSDKRIFARDWKSGEPLAGRLRPVEPQAA